MAKKSPPSSASRPRRRSASPASPASIKVQASIKVDVLVVGGGLVGLTLAVALVQSGLEVAVVERSDPARQAGASYDGRASAIARGSKNLLQAVGLWEAMAKDAQPIRDIRVSDGKVGRTASRLFLHYRGAEIDDAPLGYLIENRVIRQALQSTAAGLDRLVWLAPVELASLDRGADKVDAVLADRRRISARLVVAADGARSRIRREAGIRTLAWDYPQVGIVATLAHERPHQGVAHECFLPSGPFAMLPLIDGPTCGPVSQKRGLSPFSHRSSIVWTERRALAPALLALDDQAFAREIERRFGDSLGALRVIGERWSYPLSLLVAHRATDRRLALIGDAAHLMHPIAGQGLNLGLRDVAALAEVVVDASRLGLDPGDPQHLARYERWRRFDSLALIAVTDGLNRLFSNDLAPLRLVRDLGLAAVNRMPMAKRFFMRHAMGLVGDLPRLIQGQRL